MLYVELIHDETRVVVDSKILKIDNLIAVGDFQLSQSYLPGKYTLRAYTKWNRNFGDDFITTIPINVFTLNKQKEEAKPITNIIYTKDSIADNYQISLTLLPNSIDSLHRGKAKLFYAWEGGIDSLVFKSKFKEENKVVHTIPKGQNKIEYTLRTKNEVFSEVIYLDENQRVFIFFSRGRNNDCWYARSCRLQVS